MHNRMSFTVAYFGILHAGATVVPISFLSVGARGRLHAHRLGKCRPHRVDDVHRGSDRRFRRQPWLRYARDRRRVERAAHGTELRRDRSGGPERRRGHATRRHRRRPLHLRHDRAAEGRGVDTLQHVFERSGGELPPALEPQVDRTDRTRVHDALRASPVSLVRPDLQSKQRDARRRRTELRRAVRARGVSSGDGARSRHALFRRADDVHRPPRGRERRRAVRSFIAALLFLRRRSASGRSHLRFREALQRQDPRRLRPFGNVTGGDVQPSAPREKAGIDRRCSLRL